MLHAIYHGDNTNMTTAKKRVIDAAKKADRVEYFTIMGLAVAALYLEKIKLVTVVGVFWSFETK